MNEFEQMYREVILDHYKNPRGHGVMEGADAEAEGQNPLCGDEVSIYVAFADDGETIDEVKFSGRGCAISQAATSMLMDMVTGRTATEFAAYFGDFDLVPPGIMPVTEWPIDTIEPPQSPPLRLVPAPTSAGMLAGIGRKRP